MSSNCLQLNPAKTQQIWLGTPQQLSKIDLASLTLIYPHFTFLTTVQDLDVTLDRELTFTQHINLLCRSCYYQLRQLKVISHSLTPNAGDPTKQCRHKSARYSQQLSGKIPYIRAPDIKARLKEKLVKLV